MAANRIEKRIDLRATLASVWQAISDDGEFGRWFGVRFDGPFVEGSRLTGRIAPTTVDAAIAKLQEPHAGKAFEFVVVRIEPMRRCEFQWHPFAIDPQVDYSTEPMTSIVFELVPQTDGVLLTITESGFDRLRPARRDAAWAANDGGWQMQTLLIARYLALHDGG